LKFADPLLIVRSLSKSWKGFEIKDVNMNVRRGEYFVVMGPTGAGKTLLLQLIAGIHYPDSGKIILENVDVTHLSPEERSIGYVPQNYALFPHMSVRENIAYGLRVRRYPKEEIKKLVRRLSEELGIENLLDRRVSTLSGGEQQRVALARALAIEPKLLLLDEPLSALDAKMVEEIRDYLKKLRRSIGFTAIHVTHDFIEAVDLGDRMAVMFDGRILQVGRPIEVINWPKNELVASFTGVKNILKGRVVDKAGGLAEIDIDGLRIYALTEKAEDVMVAIRPESIIVTLEPVKMSARNVLEGVVCEVSETPPYVSLKVDSSGKIFTVYLTKNAVEDLKLREGRKVYLAFKATDVRVL